MASVKTILFCLPTLPILFCLITPQSSALSLSLGHVEINFASLYNESDKIVLLNITNFKSTITNKPNAWFVEFYSSWCGHCINFAPTWKDLAKDVYGWRNVIQVAAIDCALEENNSVCRDYEVMAYPSLKFFPPYVNDTFLGVSWSGPKPKTKEGLMEGMVNFVEENVTSILQPVDELDCLEDLWAKFGTDNLLLIFEEPASGYWSREAILDLSASINVPPIRRVSSHHEKLVKTFQVPKFPSLVLARRNGRHQIFPLESPDRSSLEHVIREVLNQENTLEEHNLIINESPKMSKASETPYSNPQRKLHDTVFMSDLEKAVHYSLTHEVAMHKVLIGAKLEALVNYVAILKKYFPARSPLQRFFNQLLNWLEQHPDGVTGKEYKTFVAELIKKHLKEWPKELSSWRGCKGSQPQFRGYPCALWSLFHTLTVEGDLAPDPLEVLQGIKGYVATFFGCAECAHHFVAMAEEDLNSVTTYEESVLWLWQAHNKANKRLAGEPSEDPEFPKIEFPSPQSCTTCRTTSGQFDRQEVVHFLRTMYGPNIDWTGVDNTEEFYRTIWKNKRYNKNKFGMLDPKIVTKNWDTKQRFFYPEGQESKRSGFWFGGAFSGLDISLCIVLYVVSCLVLIAVFSKIIFRRKYRRKTYAFDLFGKV